MIQKQNLPECKSCGIRSCSIFSILDCDELTDVDYIKDATYLKKGQVVFQEGNSPKGIFVIHSGKIKIFKSGSVAKEQIVRLARPGDVLGYRSLISGDRYHASASALEDSIVCFIPKEHLLSLLNHSSNLSLKLLQLLSHDLANAEQKLVEISQKPVRERVAEAIIILKDLYGVGPDNKTLNVSMTREDLGNYVGTSTETAIRVLSELKDAKIISLDKKKIIVENLAALEKEAGMR